MDKSFALGAALGAASATGALLVVRAQQAKLNRSSRKLRRADSVLVRPSMDRGRKLHASSSVVEGIGKSGLRSNVGVLVHGCHLQADGWEEIVWGHPPDHLGRLPQAVLLGFEENAEVIVLGTGASVASDGRLEGQYTLDILMERLQQLHDFHALRRFNLTELQRYVCKAAMAELKSKNTIEEVRAAFEIFAERNVDRAFLVSSPTHIPRCLACACQVNDEVERTGASTFRGELYACPSETCYEGFDAGDVVVVEPPHRGDRNKALDSLPFHEMVRRSFKVSSSERERFLKDFDGLLSRYGA